MISIVIGILLIVIGGVAPASWLVGSLRSDMVSGDLQAQLRLGANLFKGGLVVLGLCIIVLSRLRIWISADTEKFCIDSHKKPTLLIVGALLLLALGLRLYGLNEGLWFDEIVTYVQYVRAPFGEIVTTYDSQNQHILYSLLAHGSFLVFGEGAWSLRLPAVLFGTGSICALYLLGREVSTPREALLSAALFTFSYHHVWFSQNARGYTGLLFWTILSSYFFLRALRTNRSQMWVLYAVSVALGAYTLIYMLFVVVGHLVIYLDNFFVRRKELSPNWWHGLFLGFGLAGLLTFQLHALLLPQVFGAFANAEVVGAVWTHPLWGLVELIKGMQVNFSGTIFALVALAIFGGGFVSYARSNRAVLWLLVIPAVACVVLKTAMAHHLWPRSLIFAAGFGALVVVRGAVVSGQTIAVWLRLHPSKLVPMGTALCLGLIAVSAMSVPFAYGPKQDFLGALTFVEDQKEPGDVVVTVGLASFPYKNLYKVDWEEIGTIEALNLARSRAKRMWLVYTIPIQMQDVYPEISATIRRDFKVVKPFYGTLNEGTVFVCQLDAESSHVSHLR